MHCRLRYTKQEEHILEKLKEEDPKATWFSIAELYNSNIPDRSRRRTEQALISKYKNIRKRKKQSNTRELDISYEKHLETASEMYRPLWIGDLRYAVSEQPVIEAVSRIAELPVYKANPTEEQPTSSSIYDFDRPTPLDFALGCYGSVEDYYRSSGSTVD